MEKLTRFLIEKNGATKTVLCSSLENCIQRYIGWNVVETLETETADLLPYMEHKGKLICKKSTKKFKNGNYLEIVVDVIEHPIRVGKAAYLTKDSGYIDCGMCVVETYGNIG